MDVRLQNLGLCLLLAAVAAASAATPALGGDPHASSIRLSDQAGAEGPAVLLKHVAALEGGDAEALADLVVGEFSGPSKRLVVTLAHIRATLEGRHVNLGRLTLAGYAQCQVERLVPQPPAMEAELPAPPLGNPAEEVELTTPVTVRDRVAALLFSAAGGDPVDLRITFAESDKAALALPAVGNRFEFEPGSTATLGRIPLTIRQYQGDRLIATHRVTADVSRRALVVVAREDLTRGQLVTHDDVQIREVYLNSPRDVVRSAGDAVGRNTTAVIRAGAVLSPQQLRSPLLVRRGDLVTVRCIRGNLVVKTVARALEDGSLDQVISVRNEASREAYTVKVMGVQEALISEENSAARGAGGDA